MQNPLRDENPVVGSNPAPPNNRVTKKATKHRSGKSNPIQNVPPPPPEDAVPSNGVDYDEEEEPSEIESFNLDDHEDEDDDDDDDEDDEDESDDEDDDKSLNVDSGEEDDDEDEDDDDEEDDSVDPEFLLDEEEEDEEAGGSAACRDYQVDPVTQARLEALLETAGIGKISGESKPLADPEVLKRLTSSVSCALDEAAAALTRMRSEPPTDGRSLVEACNEGDISKVRKLLDEGRVSVHDTTEEGESLLSLACSAGYYELAQVLLAMRANVEDRGMKGDCTPLMEAASAGHTDIVKLLIGHCADVNAQSSSGNTPLMYACAGGHEAVVRLLLENGSHVEDHNENGHTPLMEAASAGHVGVAKILLQYGAGINTHSNEFKESALTLACYKGHLEMVRFLLDAGADQEHKTDEMHTALMEASMDGHVEVARLLLDSGAQVNMPADSFESPLTLAACGGHVELAMLLLERGANIEEVNDEGYTPLMEAAREGHEEMVALLLSQGADINAQTEETQETALTLACCGGFLEVADFLIKAGADLELGASTPLMEAAQEGHLDLVKYLLENGALVNAQTGTGDTALTYACENGHTDVADLLLQYNAELEHESEGGRTPLMKAARAGHLCTVQFLISKGADVNRSTSNNDHTPLSLACAGGHLAVVELLLQHGADPYHKLKDNSTMLIEAAKGGHTPVVGLLLDYPRSIVMATPPATNLAHPQQQQQQQHQVTLDQDLSQVPVQIGAASIKNVVAAAAANSLKLRKTQRPPITTAAVKPLEAAKPVNVKTGLTGTSPLVHESTGYDFIEGSGFVIEGLEDKGLDAKSYIQSMLRRTEGSSREEQIIQKEQILAELQRVEKELQEKAQAQMMLSAATSNMMQRQQEHQQLQEPVQQQPSSEPLQNNTSCIVKQENQQCVPVSSAEPSTSSAALAVNSTTTQTTSSSLSSRTANLANLPPSERPKAKPSRKICFVDGAKTAVGTAGVQSGIAASGKKMQLQAALQQHSQQLAQLQQLQQLNQQLQQQVLQQRQLKQQNQATLAALQQNAIANQQQLAALQQNVAQLQQLEQHILSQQAPASVSAATTNNGQQQHAQLQQRVQQILQQKQQLQQQIKQFQLQVEQQLAYTQHATTNPSTSGGETPPPQPPPALGPGETSVKTNASRNKRSKDEANAGGSHAYELVQASQALQAVQALNLDSGIDPQDLSHDQALLMDPSHLAAAVQNCPIPLDANCQAILNGYKEGLQVGQSLTTTLQIQYPGLSQTGSNGLPIIADCNQGTSQPFGHPLLLQAPQFPFGPASVDSSGQINFNADDSGPFLQANESLFLPNNANTCTGVGPPDPSHQHHHRHHLHHVGAGVPEVSKVPGKKAKSSTKKKDQDPNELIDKRADLFPQLDPVVGQVSAAGGLPPIDGYTASVDLDSETESNHDTALTLACAGGHEELVKLLLERGADIEHRDKKGFTPLILAATAGHEKVVEILLDHHADIEAQSERTKDTPLSLACSGGRYEVVESLLRRNANKEHRNVSDYTPLSLAASGGYVNIIKLLLAHGAEINSRTGSKLGISPLMLAAMNGHTSAVKLLLDMGSDINAQIETNRNTALTLACFQGRHEVVSLLLDRKANVEHRAKTGLTPLMEAASGGYVDVGRVLLDKGADVNAPPVPSSRDTALTIAADKGHYRFVELLLSRGAQVDVRNKKGNSSLWLAANGGHLEVVQLLYSAGADIDSQDNRKVSCLMAAFRKGHTKVVKWMVKHVTQFPSDQETARYIQTLSGSGDSKDILKKCHQCMEVIRIAKDRQAAEAAKNASSLLEELDREKNLEESKKAAAARKREKKKRKKLERQQKSGGGSETKSEDKNDDDDDDYEKENRIAEVEEEDEEEENVNNHDSGIDANSQGSMDNPEKTILPIATSTASTTSSASTINNNNSIQSNNKKNKKNRNAKKEATDAAPSGGLKEKIENEAVEEAKPVIVAAPSTIEQAVTSPPAPANQRLPTKGRASRRDEKLDLTAPTAPSPKKNGQQQQGSGRQSGAANASGGTGRNAATPAVGETGWKEVVRKSKKVSVPAHAISRVIGRGGCNINAIRELSGAHIEVEKQGQKMGSERSILIKGSAEATRQAHAWIQTVISCPDKDIADIVGKQQMKILQQSQSSGQQQPVAPPQASVVNSTSTKEIAPSKSPNFNAPAIASAAVSAAPTTVPTKSTGKGNQQATKSSTTSSNNKKNSASNPPSSGKGSSSIPAFATAKPASSFAAVASGSSGAVDNFAGMMIQTGTHPGSLKNKQRPSSAVIETSVAVGAKDSSNSGPASSKQHSPASQHSQQQQPTSQQTEKKSEYPPFGASSPTSESQPTNNSGSSSNNTSSGSAKIGSDFSPFRSIKMSWAVKEESENKNFARAAATGLPPPTIPLPPSSIAVQDLEDHRPRSPGLPDMSKAPGYRAGVGSGRIGSPHGGTWNPAAGDAGIFPERCNSAPGTPMSPVVPPIGPPPPPLPLPQQSMSSNSGSIGSKSNMSPGSEPDHYRSGSEPDPFRSGFATGNLSTLGRSMTPDSMGDHNKEMFRRNPGGGKPGKSAAAIDSGIVQENLLNAAAQIVSMSNSAGGFSDFSSTGSGDFRFTEMMANARFSVPSSSAAPLHIPLANNVSNSFNQSTLPPLTKPPPPTPASTVGSSVKLNPNAPDFMRIQTPGADYLRANPTRMPSAPPSKSFHQFGASRFNPQGPPPQPPPIGGMHGIPTNQSSFQNILTNQGINAFLSQQQQQPPSFDFPAFDVNLSGRTLRELTELLSVDPGANTSMFNPPIPPAPTGFMGGLTADTSGKFSSRPIGSERHTVRPPPPPPPLTKSPWDLSGAGLYDPLSSSELPGGHPQSNFGFPTGLTGATGFEGFGKSSFNGSSTDYVSPMKSDFSFNSNLGGSAGKKVSNSYIDLSSAANNRPDPASVRRNMNQIWGKSWGTDDL